MDPDLQALVGRLVLDSNFRASFFESPHKYSEEYNLSEEEIDALMKIDRHKLYEFSGTFDQSLTK